MIIVLLAQKTATALFRNILVFAKICFQNKELRLVINNLLKPTQAGP